MIFGLGGPGEDATRLYNEARGITLRLQASGKVIPATLDTYVNKTMTGYYNYYKLQKYTPEVYNSLMKRAYDFVMPKLKDIASGITIVPTGAPTTPDATGAGIGPDDLNVLGVGIPKKYLVYGGIGVGLLVLISFLKGKK